MSNDKLTSGEPHNQKGKMNDEKKTEQGTGSIQRPPESDEAGSRKKIASIRQGHTSGGYCETEELKKEEKKLAAILEAKANKLKHTGGSDARGEIQRIEREIRSFAWKPKLVVAPEE